MDRTERGKSYILWTAVWFHAEHRMGLKFCSLKRTQDRGERQRKKKIYVFCCEIRRGFCKARKEGKNRHQRAEREQRATEHEDKGKTKIKRATVKHRLGQNDSHLFMRRQSV